MNSFQRDTRHQLLDAKKLFTRRGRKGMNEINWKEELLDSANFNKKQENLLKNGDESLTDSWLIGVLYTRWKKLQEIRSKPIPNCSSTFQEWSKKVQHVDKCQS